MASNNLGVVFVRFYLTVAATDRGIDFSPHNRVDTGLGAAGLLCNNYQGLIFGGKVGRAWSWSKTPPSTKNKNSWDFFCMCRV